MFRIPLLSMVERLTAGLAATVLLVVALPGTNTAQGAFTYDILAQGDIAIGGSTFGRIRKVALNSSGGAAFVADIGGGSRALFTPTSRLARTGDTIGGETLGNLFHPDINDSGQVVFWSSLGAGRQGIFTPTSKVAAPGDTIGGKVLSQVWSNPNINNAGTITFKGKSSTGNPFAKWGIYSQSSLIRQEDGLPGPITLIAASGKNSLNNSGTVAFEGKTTANRPAIFTQGGTVATGGPAGTVIDGIRWIGGTVGGAGTTIGDSGLVGWVGRGRDVATNQIIASTLFTQDRVIAKTGDIIDGIPVGDFLGSTPEISINGSGKVAYTTRSGATRGIFVEQDKVAATGDTILGKNVGALGALDFNDSGQVLFEAQLDGTFSLVLATLLPSGGFISNGDFQIPALDGWTVSGLGSAQATEFPASSGNLVAQLTAGSEVILSQNIDTPGSPYWFSYDYLFTSTDGLLDVFLNSFLIDSIMAPGSLESDFITRRFLVDDPALRGLTDVELAFHFNGPTGFKVLLDNVSIAPVPEPSTLAIWGLLGLCGIGWRCRARKRGHH